MPDHGQATFQVTLGERPPVRIIPRNETPAAKLYRLAEAQFREFTKEYPDKAVKIVRELVPSVVK